MDEYELLSLALQWIMQATEAKHGTIYLYDAQERLMTAVVVRGEDCPPEGFREAADQGMLGEVLRTQRTVYTPDYAASPHYLPEWPLHAAAVAPMLARDQILGAIAIGSQPDRAFDGMALHLLNLLAIQATTVLDNRRLFQAEQQKARQLQLLNNLTYAANSFDDISALLNYMAHTLKGLFDSDNCYFSLWDEAKQIPIPTTATTPQRDLYRSLPITVTTKTFARSVMEAGKPLFVQDVATSDLINPAISSQFPARSLLGLPLIMGENRLGAAFLGFDQTRRITPEDLRSSEQIANQVALVLARAQLLDRERRQRDLTETQLAFSQKLMETTSISEAASVLLETTGTLVDFSSGAVMLFEENWRVARIAASQGYRDPDAAQAKAIPLEDYPLLREMTTQIKPIYIPDVRQDDRWQPSAAPDTQEIRAILFIPLYHQKNHLIGSLTLKSVAPDAFPPGIKINCA